MADRAIKTMTLLAHIPESDDEAVGFHAQQAVEKCLKAVLSLHQIPFRKTHDLGELIDLLSDAGKPTPPEATELEFFNPFAVIFRYDVIDLETFDRNQAKDLIKKVRVGAGSLIS